MRKFHPPRSRFGLWLERNGISLMELSRKSGIHHTTLSKLAGHPSQRPSRLTERKLRPVLREYGVDTTDFWDLGL
ncbi:transcriptional regulator [Alicyclobacillus tolerans]|uniref:Lambda repressor-like predicted transcriptional regulator n=3 Tax=Alicyclobacillus tolerans TaxID=90970 RepID=A0ABT9M078_9BACL|nr:MULTISPECIES: helix-turn-helix transcriptional regulator [Alicyclobacillus]MDP9729922.1 lambda repressor-like predicted transcriptional regulator [Alicyclobacillus tengchongensis]QRF23509.1 helix-turn-helix transcriptional regulator [Alicyclobacillus sp. TC]QRF24916.1 helix-turn-helix transcriptional regulator [Alicyclobacillus sp. TC]